MTQNTTTETDTPIDDDIIADVADKNPDIDVSTVKRALDAAQTAMADDFNLYRDPAVVAETEDILITLSEYDLSEEVAEFDDETADELETVVSQAHRAAFRWTEYRKIAGFDRRAATDALSKDIPHHYARIIRKPARVKPTMGDVDVEYRIQYNHGHEQPRPSLNWMPLPTTQYDHNHEQLFQFIARARATLTGGDGTLEIERTYRAVPDADSDEPSNDIQIQSESTHVASDTLVNNSNESRSLTETFPWIQDQINPHRDDLRRWVYNDHTEDFEQEYLDIQQV